MNLQTNSWHAKLYLFYFGTGYSWNEDKEEVLNRLPKNLCPYVWKLFLGILLTPIMLPFYFFASFIYFVGDLIAPHWDFDMIKDELKETGLLSKSGVLCFFTTVVTLLIPSILVGMICIFWSKNGTIMKLGVLGWTIFVIAGTAAVIYYFSTREKKPKGEKKKYLLTEFIKAKYNKNCPIIEWDKNEQKSETT